MNNYNDDKNYLEFGGDYLYIDFDEIINVVKLENAPTKDEDGNDYPSGVVTIDVTKWELVNKMIDTILDEMGEEDPTLGKKNLEKLSVSFKLAYNTLLNYNILKIVEE